MMEASDYQVKPFYIPATASQQERRLRTLKHNDTFAVFDYYGDFIASGSNPDGLYYQDMRFLSTRVLLLNDSRPLLLSSTMEDNNTLLTVDLTNPDVIHDGQILMHKDTIHLVRSVFLWEGACYERLRVHNFGERAHDFSLTLSYASDFTDLFEVRGMKRLKRGRTVARVEKSSRVSFTYRGQDDRLRRFSQHFLTPPDAIDTEHVRYELHLEPHASRSLFFLSQCQSYDGDVLPETEDFTERKFFASYRRSRQQQRMTARHAASVETSSKLLNEVLSRSMSDLYMLMTQTEHGLYPYAGIPWFSTAFGRDGIITALEMLWIDPTVARGVLRFLAATQATEMIPEADAEPGKIMHETRQCEMARTGEVPFGLYYGSVDSTPLFVLLAARYFERTGELALIEELWPHIEAALRWIDEYGDADGDGLVEYHRQRESGLANQCWKDSEDSVFHADGQLAQGPLILAEVQGYVYAAKCELAPIARRLGHGERAAALEEQASRLKERFNQAFWCHEIGMYALALDRDKKPCVVRSSNAGQLLFSGLPDLSQAMSIAEQMVGPAFFSGWGIRTIADGEARYNPMSYHNGSIWPHDNAVIALGMARYGLKAPCRRIFTGLFDAATYMDQRRLPELFCGFKRRPGNGPTSYPVACSPQAWAAATPYALLAACLGIEFDAEREEIRLHYPTLPDFIDQLTIKNLTIGGTRVDLSCHRYGGKVAVNVLAKEGRGEVLVRL